MRFYLAPLAEITSKEFRLLCYEGGADVCYSEMISARAVTLRNKKTIGLSEIDSREPETYLQFFGGEPEIVREAAEKILSLVTPAGVDLNAGCPVRKVVASHAGSQLMEDPERLGRIVKALRSVTSLPLSVKIRKGFKHPSYLECALTAQENGADFLICHPRLRTEMFSGVSDFSVSVELAEKLDIPVIHSGDIHSPDDLKFFENSNIYGIMVGRAALGRPWIFDELKGKTVTEERKRGMMRRHFQFYLDLSDKFGHTMIRRHAAWYSTGKTGSAEFRNSVFSPANDIGEVVKMINKFFGLDL